MNYRVVNSPARALTVSPAPCRGCRDSLVVEFLAPVDDDGGFLLNGKLVTGELTEWDYGENFFADTWRVFNDTNFPPPWPVGGRQPVFSSLQARRVSWWAGPNWGTVNFFKMRYTGPLRRGDVIDVLVVNIAGNYRTAPWRVTLGDRVLGTGGETHIGPADEGDYFVWPGVPWPNTDFIRCYKVGSVIIP